MPEGTLGNTSIILETSPEAQSFAIANQSQSDMFTIYPDSGLLAVEEYVTDYEKGLRSFVVVIEAVAPDDSTATCTLTVVLEDINDEAPTFSSSLYKVVLPETMLSGDSVTGLTVSDADANPLHRKVILSISDGDTDKRFTIYDDGVIKVAERKHLYNATGFYLTVTASDGVNEGTTHVLVGICPKSFLSGSDVTSVTKWLLAASYILTIFS